MPLSNVFKGQSTGPSGLGVSGRIESGIVQVGEKLAVLPGDETAVVRSKGLLFSQSPYIKLANELSQVSRLTENPPLTPPRGQT